MMEIDGIELSQEQELIVRSGARPFDWDVVDGHFVSYVPPGGMTSSQIFDEKISCMKYLENTDYKALKFFEGAMTEEEFAPIRRGRQDARARINELELMLASRGSQSETR